MGACRCLMCARQRYTRESKIEAVELAQEGRTVAQAARDLGLERTVLVE